MVFWPAERPLEPTRTGIVNVSVAPELSVPIVKVIDPLATARVAVALAVPLLKLTAYRAPTHTANPSSNSSTLGPVVSQSDRSVSTTA